MHFEVDQKIKPPVIVYHLFFPKAAQQKVSILLETEILQPEPFEVWMATWTPGSYLIREYAKHVDSLHAKQSMACLVQKTKKNCWQIFAQEKGKLSICYELYAAELTVRSNFVDEQMALLCGPATFISSNLWQHLPCEVHLHLPSQWRDVACSLANQSSPSQDVVILKANDLDTLLDSPILLGNLQKTTLAKPYQHHQLVSQTAFAELFDTEKASQDMAAIAAVLENFFQTAVSKNYTFLTVLGGARGGLEHSHSSVLMTSYDCMLQREQYIDFLSLVCHEWFHAWNGKSCHPQGLGPFNYHEEAYTDSLWLVEGITSYYDDLLIERSGLCSREEYLSILSRSIHRDLKTAGRYIQSLANASLEAWIKFYRPNAHSLASSVSYYNKGALLSFCLDAYIREQSNDSRSLDDVVRASFKAFPKYQGYTQDQYLQLLDEVCQQPISQWLRPFIYQPIDLPYESTLERLGLQWLEDPQQPKSHHGEWGLTYDNRNPHLTIETLVENGPAQVAGLQVGDELIGIDGRRLLVENFQQRQTLYKPQQNLSLLLCRRQQLIHRTITLGIPETAMRQLTVNKQASSDIQCRQRHWLGDQGSPS